MMSSHSQKPNGELLDHNYDGIQELDNPLPRWWVYLFYITSVFAVFYIGYYHFGPGLSLAQKLELDLAKNMPKKSSSETNVVIAEGPEWVKKGDPIFVSKCVSCHGPKGEGLVGPNLTDEYWIHGKGSIKDIVAVVTKGVPEKGMIAWETQLKPEEIMAVSNYVHSLKGTHPANAKAPQGDHVE